MTAPIIAAAIFCIATTTFHVATIGIAIRRFRRSPRRGALSEPHPPVTLVRPVCGLDNFAADTLRSTFALAYQPYEILFCVATASDPVVPLVEALMAEYPGAKARLLIGDDRLSSNPKLNNVFKGWGSRPRLDHHHRQQCADAAGLHSAAVCKLARGYRARRVAPDRLPPARVLGRDRMRV